MKLNTKHFGEIEVEEEKIITFKDGLPGFDDLSRFILFDEESNDGLFLWMQSIDDPTIAFVLLDTLRVMPLYDPIISEESIISLGDTGGDTLPNILCYNIAVVEKSMKDTRVNLKAPIIINQLTKKGCQVLCSNEDYDIKCKIFAS
ncbi:MAG: flagellar assembly protein FliW [Lachnospirales bacterium]